MLALRADGVALDRFDSDPIPLRIIEIQQRHHVLGAFKLVMVVVQFRRPRWRRAMIHDQHRAAVRDRARRAAQQLRAVHRDRRMQELRRHQVEDAVRKTLGEVVPLKVDAALQVAGCRVTEGVVRKGAKVRIIRQDIVVLELGTLQTLKRFKDEVNEVPSGQECGMMFAGFQDIKVGDTIECFTVEEIKRQLD